MEKNLRLAVFGHKRWSREGGIEIVVKELCTRMAPHGMSGNMLQTGQGITSVGQNMTIRIKGNIRGSARNMFLRSNRKGLQP